MKKKFSKSWKSSKQPRKQRKYLANAPLHLRKNFVSINLSKDLRTKISKRNISAKKGDKVIIKIGKFKGKTGKILGVDLKKSKIVVENIQTKKQDGSKVNVKLQPSNLQIIELAERITKKQIEEIKKPIKKPEVKKDSTNKVKEKKK